MRATAALRACVTAFGARFSWARMSTASSHGALYARRVARG
jgi:hypothetical protein